jgi:hypothetical protein
MEALQTHKTEKITDIVWYYINWKDKTASVVPGIEPPMPHPMEGIVIRKFNRILNDEEVQTACKKVA